MKLFEARCPECGASRKALERTLVLVCEYCGAYMGLDQDPGAALDLTRRVMAYVRNPTAESTRFNELSMLMQDARGRGDRQTFRLLASEYYALYAILYPGSVPAEKGRESIKKWLIEAVVIDELNSFDEAVKRAFQGYTGPMSDISSMKLDPMAWARSVLEGAEKYYAAIKSHPDCPPGAFSQSPKFLARKAAEPVFSNMVMMLGAETLEKIRREVLGEKEDAGRAAVCPECGAPLPEGERFKCPFCGSLLVVQKDDEWVSKNVVYFNQAVENTMSLTHEGAVMLAFSFISMTAQQDGNFPAQRAVTFLKRTVPWAQRKMILKQAQLLFESDATGLLGRLRPALASWAPEGTPPVFGPKQAAAADPNARWTEELLRLWRQSMKNLATVQDEAVHLVSNCLYPFFTGSACTIDHAMGFLSQVERRCTNRDLAEAAALMKPGYESNPQVRDFLVRLESRLRRT